MSSPNAVGQVPELPVDMRRSLSSAMHSVGLQVDRDNVLRVRSVLLTEAEKLLDAVTRSTSEQPWVDLCGADPVSGEASAAFNARIKIVTDHCRQYALQLERAGNSLDRRAELRLHRGRDPGIVQELGAGALTPLR